MHLSAAHPAERGFGFGQRATTSRYIFRTRYGQLSHAATFILRNTCGFSAFIAHLSDVLARHECSSNCRSYYTEPLSLPPRLGIVSSTTAHTLDGKPLHLASRCAQYNLANLAYSACSACETQPWQVLPESQQCFSAHHQLKTHQTSTSSNTSTLGNAHHNFLHMPFLLSPSCSCLIGKTIKSLLLLYRHGAIFFYSQCFGLR